MVCMPFYIHGSNHSFNSFHMTLGSRSTCRKPTSSAIYNHQIAISPQLLIHRPFHLDNYPENANEGAIQEFERNVHVPRCWERTCQLTPFAHIRIVLS